MNAGNGGAAAPALEAGSLGTRVGSQLPPQFDSSRDKGIRDLLLGLRRADMWSFLALHEVRQRYRRSILGPLWITMVLAMQVVGIGLLYSGLLNQDLSVFLLYLAAGLTVWALISGLLVDGSTLFINSANSIRSVVAPISIQLFRVLAQHAIIFAHNLVLVAVVAALYRHNPGWGVLLAIPGFALCLLNLGWFVLLLAMMSARFRDVPLIVSSLIMLMLIMTPIFWRPEMLTGRSSAVVSLNPLYYLLEIVRGPLIGTPIPLAMWIGLAVSAVVGWIVAALVYDRLHQRIPFWV